MPDAVAQGINPLYMGLKSVIHFNITLTRPFDGGVFQPKMVRFRYDTGGDQEGLTLHFRCLSCQGIHQGHPEEIILIRYPDGDKAGTDLMIPAKDLLK